MNYENRYKKLEIKYRAVCGKIDALLEERQEDVKKLYIIAELVSGFVNKDQAKELEIKIEEFEKNNYNEEVKND